MKLFAIQNRRDARVWLGRDGVREFPLCFANRDDAMNMLKDKAQVPSDWRIVAATVEWLEGEQNGGGNGE